jgi:hypothetical protein
MAYKSPFDDWHLYRRGRSGPEIPAGSRARIDVTDLGGHVIHQEYVGSDPRAARRVYDEARAKHGRGNYCIFYNSLGSTADVAGD